MYNVTLKCVRVTILSWQSNNYCVFWVPVRSRIQHEMCMRRITESSVACLVLPQLSTVSQTRQDFQGGGEVIDHDMCIWISSTIFSWNISYSKKNWTRYVQKRI